MEQLILEGEQENKYKGLIVSLVVHILLLLFVLSIPYFTITEPPKELGGIVVAFGTPDGGNSTDDLATISDSDDDVDEEQPKETTDKSSSPPKPTAPSESASSSSSKAKTDIKPVVENSEVKVPVENNKKSDAQSNENTQADIEAKKAADAEANRKAEEARVKAEEEAKKAEYEKSKSKFSDLFGSGKGNNDNTGDQGDPDGDPDSSILEGVSTGSGRISGGLSKRDVLYEPEINDNTQKVGKVVIKVCVDNEGNVGEAEFTQRGSTTTDTYLVNLAIKAAKKYKFSPSDIGTQCGNITMEFKVK